MSRFPFSRFRLWPAASRTRPPPDDPDRVLVGLCRDLAGTVSALQLLLSADGRDTDEIPGFDALADRERALVARIVVVPAASFAGLLAKARAARLRPEISGYDGAASLALSLADDLIRIADIMRTNNEQIP